jgi:hypothetical protein
MLISISCCSLFRTIDRARFVAQGVHRWDFRGNDRKSRRNLVFPFSNSLARGARMKKIKVRKAGTVRLTSAATLYDCGCAAN